MSRQEDRVLPKTVVTMCQNPRMIAILVAVANPPGAPHTALISAFETMVMDGTFYFWLFRTSRTSTTLESNGPVTLAYMLPEGVYYLKGNATRVQQDSPVAVFSLELTEVLSDQPAAEETEAQLVSGIRFTTSPSDTERRLALRENIRNTLEKASQRDRSRS